MSLDAHDALALVPEHTAFPTQPASYLTGPITLGRKVCQLVGGFARIANRITRPLHSTFPAGSGARAHGLRAKAGAPFLSFFLSFHDALLTCQVHW